MRYSTAQRSTKIRLPIKWYLGSRHTHWLPWLNMWRNVYAYTKWANYRTQSVPSMLRRHEVTLVVNDQLPLPVLLSYHATGVMINYVVCDCRPPVVLTVANHCRGAPSVCSTWWHLETSRPKRQVSPMTLVASTVLCRLCCNSSHWVITASQTNGRHLKVCSLC